MKMKKSSFITKCFANSWQSAYLYMEILPSRRHSNWLKIFIRFNSQ